MSVSRKEAIAKLWELGNLTWKLDSNQKIMYASYADTPNKTVVWSCSRRIGKSYTLCIIAIEMCLKVPNAIVKYVAPQQKMVRTIIRPLIRDILLECPEHLRPKFYTQDNCWRFPNGSELQIAGTDNGNAENLRGGNAHLCLVDEAGFCDDLEYLVQSILLPTMTTTNGKIILASTPPVSPDHPFVDYITRAEAVNMLVKKTIMDNPRLSKEQIDEYIRELGGIDHPNVRREYFAELIVDKTRAVVPEWNDEVQAECVKAHDRPPFYDWYVSMDIGFKDLTVALFAYYDFRLDKIVIEDELVMSGTDMTTDALASSLKAKEAILWRDHITGEVRKPYMRICDNNLIVINDLQRLHDLTFLPTSKDDSDAALNHMRMMIASKKIIINPRCKVLISHLKNAVWKNNRKSFDRSADKGHYDAIDALKYLIRNINYTHNPYPPTYDLPKGELHKNGWYNQPDISPIAQMFKDIFTTKRPSIRKDNPNK